MNTRKKTTRDAASELIHLLRLELEHINKNYALNADAGIPETLNTDYLVLNAIILLEHINKNPPTIAELHHVPLSRDGIRKTLMRLAEAGLVERRVLTRRIAGGILRMEYTPHLSARHRQSRWSITEEGKTAFNALGSLFSLNRRTKTALHPPLKKWLIDTWKLLINEMVNAPDSRASITLQLGRFTQPLIFSYDPVTARLPDVYLNKIKQRYKWIVDYGKVEQDRISNNFKHFKKAVKEGTMQEYSYILPQAKLYVFITPREEEMMEQKVFMLRIILVKKDKLTGLSPRNFHTILQAVTPKGDAASLEFARHFVKFFSAEPWREPSAKEKKAQTLKNIDAITKHTNHTTPTKP